MSVTANNSQNTEYRILVTAGGEELARQEAVKAAISAEAARLSAIDAEESEQVATEKAAQTVEDAASALASKLDAEISATASGGFATNSGISASASNTAKGLSEAAKEISIEEAGKSSTSAGQSAGSAAESEAAKNVVLANIIDPATQIEVSGNVTALEAWRNKVIIVTNDSTITIPSALFTSNWTFRVIVRNGILQIAKLGAKTFAFGNPEPFINQKSDFTIRQRVLTQEVIITGNIISTAFEALFQTKNVLAGGSNDFQVRLPFVSTSFEPVIVDWGDGIVESIATFNAASVLHTYQNRGSYRIKIYGNSFYMPFGNSAERLKIVEVFSWGRAVIGTNGFFGCTNLTFENVVDIPSNLSNNLEGLFRGCASITQVRGMNNWNVSSVTNMKLMFFGATAFNQNIGAWNTGNVVNMEGMMRNATAFNQNIGSWNVSNVVDMDSMMRNTSAFNQNIGAWNTGNVSFMQGMFQSAIAFNQNIGSWNVSNVINMQSMFDSATAFNQNIGAWNVSNVVNMQGMFQSAIAFNQNIGAWNTQNLTNAQSMFQGATAFNQNISSWQTGSVTNMEGMFFSATAFNQNIGAWNTGNVVNMEGMMRNATAFNQNIGSWNISNIINILDFMFQKTSLNYSTENYNALLIGWASRPVKTNISINFGTIKYTSAASAARAILTSSPNFWTIIDGGI